MNLHWMIDWLQSYQQGGKVFEIQKYIFGFFLFTILCRQAKFLICFINKDILSAAPIKVCA